VTLPRDLAESVASIAETLFFGALIAGVVAIIRRFRAARGVERQQLKWFTFAAGITAAGFGCLFVASLWPALEPIGNVGWPVGMVGLSSIPVAAGIAILRHRLYDIDLLINRTLVYGALTVTLGAVYVGSVILLQGLLSSFTGGNSLAVAASTLIVAALFGPVRRRIQAAVDRRFYRSRYDAARTLEEFSSRLRDERGELFTRAGGARDSEVGEQRHRLARVEVDAAAVGGHLRRTEEGYLKHARHVTNLCKPAAP